MVPEAVKGMRTLSYVIFAIHTSSPITDWTMRAARLKPNYFIHRYYLNLFYIHVSYFNGQLLCSVTLVQQTICPFTKTLKNLTITRENKNPIFHYRDQNYIAEAKTPSNGRFSPVIKCPIPSDNNTDIIIIIISYSLSPGPTRLPVTCPSPAPSVWTLMSARSPTRTPRGCIPRPVA